MKLRRVLFAAQLESQSGAGYKSGVARVQGLESLGVEVVPFETGGWSGRSRVESLVAGRLWVGPTMLRRNAAILAAAAKHRPDVIWIDKGNWIYPAALRALRMHARFLVHYNTDDFFCRQGGFWLARRGIRRFDLHLTTNRFNVRELGDRFGATVFRVGMGFDEAETHPLTANAAQRGVVFIGHYEPHTEEYIVALKNAGLPVRVWGLGWKRAKSAELRRTQIIPQAQYTETIAGASLALCSLSRMNRNESTGRTFEIPAIGTCLLAERTPEHSYLFRDGVEAVLFSNAEELVRKARHFLAHEKERREIARAGHQRCLAQQLSWVGHMKREWPLAERLLLTGQAPISGVDDAPFWPGFRAGEPFDGSEAAPVDKIDFGQRSVSRKGVESA